MDKEKNIPSCLRNPPASKIQWGKGKAGKAREKECRLLVNRAYEAAIIALELKFGRKNRTSPSLKNEPKEKLVALKCLARKLFADAQNADGALSRITQETDENVYRQQYQRSDEDLDDIASKVSGVLFLR